MLECRCNFTGLIPDKRSYMGVRVCPIDHSPESDEPEEDEWEFDDWEDDEFADN